MKEGPSGEKQDPAAAAAAGSKAKAKVKSIDLPVVVNSIRQLDASVLNDFVEYEVSHGLHASDHDDVQDIEPRWLKKIQHLSCQRQMIIQDKLVKEQNDAKNAVEEYVYDLRDKLGGVYEKYITEDVSPDLLTWFICVLQKS